MFIDFLIDKFENNKDKEAIIWREKSYSYNWLLGNITYWKNLIEAKKIQSGKTVIIESDTTPISLSLLLALIENRNIIIPLTPSLDVKKPEYIEIAQGEVSIILENENDFKIKQLHHKAENVLYKKLRQDGLPGLVLFSSGTSGKSKAAVHDFSKLLLKYEKKRKDYRTLAFMMFDHIGGIDTLFYSLSNSSTIILVEDRSPYNICQTIEKHRIEVLPVTPTFLNLLIISEAYKSYDMSSLKYITYGTETMPEYTLKKCSEIFPNVIIMQKYGTTEIGTLRSKSENSDSTWVKVGGEGYETRIVDGMLQIKAESAMLGYLNASSPFTDDGWFITGDEIEVKGEYIRFLGRKSEIINVGGEKVYPAEVENIIQELKNVADVTVFGEKNPIMGNIVCANITLNRDVKDSKKIIKEIKKHCQNKLENFKVPVKIHIISEKQYTERFKKSRNY